MQEEEHRDQALMALVNKLPSYLLSMALDATHTIEKQEYRAQSLTVLASQLVNDPNRFVLWKNLLHFLAYRTRSNLLSDVAALTPVLAAFGDEAMAENAQAIQDVAKWWS